MSIKHWTRQNKALLGVCIFCLLMSIVSYNYFDYQQKEIYNSYVPNIIHSTKNEVSVIGSEMNDRIRSNKSTKMIISCLFLIAALGTGVYLWTRNPDNKPNN